MRSFILYIWLCTTLLPTFSRWGTIAYYQLNKAYITRVLCQNRDKPKLNCNGKCYLAKKIKEQQERENKETGERVERIPALNLFASPLTQYQFLSAQIYKPRQLGFTYLLPIYQAPLSIDVPPPCIA